VLAVRILSAFPFFVLVAIIDGIIVFDRVNGKQVSTDELRLRLERAYSGFTSRQPTLRVSVAMLKSVPEDEKLKNCGRKFSMIGGARTANQMQSGTVTVGPSDDFAKNSGSLHLLL
jgi:hypothetical protein